MNDVKDDRPRRTIVGGQPRGRGLGAAGIPRGIEVLVKKASLDPCFCTLLLEQRAAAASQIGLELSPAETAILNSVPEAQLRAMIEHTTVPDAQRRAFLGTLGAAMLAAVLAGCEPPTPDETPIAPGGIRPEGATATPELIIVEKGIRPEVVEWTREAQRTPTRTPKATPTLKATPTPEAAATSTPNTAAGTPPPPVVRGTRPDPP